MKLSPGDQELLKCFGPSKFSAEGFLGTDNRMPEEIIAEDRETVAALGSTCEAIAGQLEVVFEKAEAAFGDAVEIKPGITAAFFESRGKVPSPFRGDGVFPKGEVVITVAKGSRQFFLTRLGIHLIGKHGFFQGRGSRYRMEPEEVVALIVK